LNNQNDEANYLVWREGEWSLHTSLTRMHFHYAEIIIRFPIASNLFKIIKSRYHSLKDSSCEPLEQDLKYCFEQEEFSLLMTHPDYYFRELGFFLQQNVANIKTHLIV
jgi:hypothetical protein